MIIIRFLVYLSCKDW